MKPDGSQIKQIKEALLDGYRTKDALRMMVQVEMNVSLDRIASGSNLASIVSSLIEWSVATDRVYELIQSAHDYNPGNPTLKALNEDFSSRDRNQRSTTSRLQILCQLREGVGLSQAEAAKMLGLTGRQARKTVAAWEQGIAKPRATRRFSFIMYLLDTLRLSQNPEFFEEVWTILEEEWGWDPIGTRERQELGYTLLTNEVDTNNSRHNTQDMFSKRENSADVEFLQDAIDRLRKDRSRGQITISIPNDIATYTPKHLDDLIAAICAAADIDSERVFLQNISSGSVRVTLELSEKDAHQLVYELGNKHPELESYSITIEQQFQPKSNDNHIEKNVILCLAAEPSDRVWLQLGKEHREIFESLNRAIYGQQFTIQQIWATKARDVLRYLLYYRPTIVHFSGHGVKNGALLFENNTGTYHRVEPHTLSEIFRGFKGDIRCVVLNSCYSHTQATQISCHVDCVIGIEGEIENVSAIAFASAFYESIASGRNMNEAYILAQAELLMENLGGSEQVRLISSENVNPSDIRFVLG